ncbi:uncharacterized protein LOC129578743 [Sitodiplosis mosellana]|uniref:uncharacterized protein LOC129578743 n=1 Tax=Sitodiplosis mosellana TaxID=263140 RepID=UPI002443CCEF|nr:uncharacterized protein LOC129578743 [Sitodiplosis mosellana]
MEGATLDYDKVQPIDPEEARLLEEYEQLTTTLHKQKLILSVMKNLNCNDIKGVDEAGKKNIDKALDFVRAYDYLKMDGGGTNALGIPDKPHELSYVEKRALKVKVLEELPKKYEKELEFCRKMEPEVINPEILDNQLLDLRAREKEMLTELAVKQVELCETLKDCVEMRFGPDQKSEVELTKSKFAVEQLKAQLIETLLEENIATMSDHMNQATDKIEFHLDNAIAEQNADDTAEKSDSK